MDRRILSQLFNIRMRFVFVRWCPVCIPGAIRVVRRGRYRGSRSVRVKGSDRRFGVGLVDQTSDRSSVHHRSVMILVLPTL